MGKGKLRILEGGNYAFHCPGCGYSHWFNDTWQFDGNFEWPTIRPSILVNRSKTPDGIKRCHFFVTAGKIEYLADCDHALAGQTVAMEDET